MGYLVCTTLLIGISMCFSYQRTIKKRNKKLKIQENKRKYACLVSSDVKVSMWFMPSTTSKVAFEKKSKFGNVTSNFVIYGDNEYYVVAFTCSFWSID